MTKRMSIAVLARSLLSFKRPLSADVSVWCLSVCNFWWCGEPEWCGFPAMEVCQRSV